MSQNRNRGHTGLVAVCSEERWSSSFADEIAGCEWD